MDQHKLYNPFEISLTEQNYRVRTPFVIWFTGISGSGKTTLASALNNALHLNGKELCLIDESIIREGLSEDLGFSSEECSENLRRGAHTARLLNQNGTSVIASFISPTEYDRSLARNIMRDCEYIEVYLRCSAFTCAERNPKRSLKKSFSGNDGYTEWIAPDYDVPDLSEIVLDTEIFSPEECRDQLIDILLRWELIQIV